MKKAVTGTPAIDDERRYMVFRSPVGVIPRADFFINVTIDNNLISHVGMNNSPQMRGPNILTAHRLAVAKRKEYRYGVLKLYGHRVHGNF